MFDIATKIALIRYLEHITIDASESRGLETMNERQLDDLIRLRRVEPTNAESMARTKKAMDRHNAVCAMLQKEREEELRKIQAEELNMKYDQLPVEMKTRFIQFIQDNQNLFGVMDFEWLDNMQLYPPIEFWTGKYAIVLYEIVSRLLFGHQNRDEYEPIDAALVGNFTYGKTEIGNICNDLLVSVLDTDIKNVLFWKYAKVRLYEE
jgi:hypothetical protein|uniref:Uncharacterized protein n=1 Tax=viral metagenome TaxID=1070528 RepID=A0A6C0F2D3_9ZZZZ